MILARRNEPEVQEPQQPAPVRQPTTPEQWARRLVVGGVAVLLVGVGLLSVPAAVILAGVLLVAVGLEELLR